MSLVGSSADEQQNLRAQPVGDVVVDLGAQEDDALGEQPLIDRVDKVEPWRARTHVSHDWIPAFFVDFRTLTDPSQRALTQTRARQESAPVAVGVRSSLVGLLLSRPRRPRRSCRPSLGVDDPRLRLSAFCGLGLGRWPGRRTRWCRSTLPSVSVTVAACTTAATVSPRRTSANIAGSWLFCCRICSSCCGSMPYCRDISTSRSVRSFWPTWMSSSSAMASINSWVLTAFSALLAVVGVELLAAAALRPPAPRRTWPRRGRGRGSRCARSSSTCACTIFSGSGTSVCSSSSLEWRCRGSARPAGCA